MLVILEVGSIVSVKVLSEYLFEILVHLLCTIVFTEMLFVIFDQFLNLILELLLSKASLKLVTTRSHSWWGDRCRCRNIIARLRGCIRLDAGGLVYLGPKIVVIWLALSILLVVIIMHLLLKSR